MKLYKYIKNIKQVIFYPLLAIIIVNTIYLTQSGIKNFDLIEEKITNRYIAKFDKHVKKMDKKIISKNINLSIEKKNEVVVKKIEPPKKNQTLFRKISESSKNTKAIKKDVFNYSKHDDKNSLSNSVNSAITRILNR